MRRKMRSGGLKLSGGFLPLFSKGICLLWIVLGSCVDPFKIDVADAQEQLVVDGMITDQPGPYTVRLFRSKDLDDQISNNLNVSGASVVISNSDGVSETLVETAPGTYNTTASGMHGMVGKTYILRITLPDGTVYESTPETLASVGNIRNVYREFIQVESPVGSDYVNAKNGFQVYVDADVLPDQEGRVRWRVTRTFEIKTYPAQRQRYLSTAGGGSVLIPDPPACSGWTYSARFGLQNPISKCDCCECWITEYSQYPVLSNLNFEKSASQVKVPIEFVPASRRIFNQKVYLQIEQMSLSENVYNFWAGIGKQQKTGSDLFQTPPPRTTGNIRALSPNAVPALGIFAASSVKGTTMVIKHEEVPYYLPPIDTIKDSCLSIYKVSTAQKPLFW
jgi:hypothetical protein